MDELTTYLNISNVPVSWMPEIRAVSYNQSQAVRTLIREALDARKARAEANGSDGVRNLPPCGRVGREQADGDTAGDKGGAWDSGKEARDARGTDGEREC